MSRQVRTARGELVDFDLLRIKEELVVNTTNVVKDKRKPRTGRRKLSAATSKVETLAREAKAQVLASEEEVVEAETPAAPKIVRKKTAKGGKDD